MWTRLLRSDAPATVVLIRLMIGAVFLSECFPISWALAAS
jgi:hypothetical protein